MCYTMKSIDLVRLNQHCNRVSIDDMMYFWKNDRKRYLYKNFEKDTYRYIEEKVPEVIYLLIKNTKDFLYYYVRKELELNISDDVDINDFIYFENEYLYKVSYFFVIKNYVTNTISKNYIRVTNYIEILPSCWIDKCVMELCTLSFDKYNNSKIIFDESINRVEKTYNNDLIGS